MSEIKMVTDVQIDLYGETQYFLVSAKQGDKATRFLRVQLMNNGNEFEIPDNVMLITNIKKPDKKFCYNECENEDNRVMVELTNQALAAAGTAYCDIEIRTKTGEKILSTAAFTIEIEPSMRNEDAILSSNEMTALDNRVQEYIDKMMAARQQILDTEAAFKITEAARALAEADRIEAEKTRIKNEKDRIEAEQTRQQQLAKMQDATTAANTAAGKANDAAERAEELYHSEEALKVTLQKVQESFEQMQDMKTEASEANTSAQKAAAEAGQAAEEANNLLDKKLNKDGDGTQVTASFTPAQQDGDISSGESLGVLFGKIARRLAAVADALAGKAASSHTHTKAEVGLGNVDNTADSEKSVHYAETAGSAVDQTARNAASSAQTTANAAMPKTGGTFTGNVVAYGTNRTSSCLRNIYVNGVSTNYILMVRK